MHFWISIFPGRENSLKKKERWEERNPVYLKIFSQKENLMVLERNGRVMKQCFQVSERTWDLVHRWSVWPLLGKWIAYPKLQEKAERMDTDAGSWVDISLWRFFSDYFCFLRETRSLVLIWEIGGVEKVVARETEKGCWAARMVSLMSEKLPVWAFAFLWPYSSVWMQAWYTVEMTCS